ncbi:hypothetical protein HZA73_09810 [candidate division TA06 bacterium]|nr:hypothetical protein [candidate division TA06 bacterium]
MDEALKKIEQALESERPASRLKEFLPGAKEPVKTPEQAMGITHYAKAPAEPVSQNQPAVQVDAPRRFEPPAEIDPASKIGVGARVFTLDELGAPSPAASPAVEPDAPRRFESPLEIDPASKIGVGAREFTLDELGGGSPAGKDPLMGQILKPTVREMTLDDLVSNGEEGK